jgi:hypothetical protein
MYAHRTTHGLVNGHLIQHLLSIPTWWFTEVCTPILSESADDIGITKYAYLETGSVIMTEVFYILLVRLRFQFFSFGFVSLSPLIIC